MSSPLPESTAFEKALHERFIKTITDLQTSLENAHTSVARETADQRQYDADTDTLARMIDMKAIPEIGLQAMEEQRTRLYTLKAQSIRRVEDLRKRINESHTILNFLQRHVCPHTGTMVHDHFDYHKREDYNKCTVCGVVI